MLLISSVNGKCFRLMKNLYFQFGASVEELKKQSLVYVNKTLSPFKETRATVLDQAKFTRNKID